MLADGSTNRAWAGKLDRTVHLPHSWWISFVRFLSRELPGWRDDPKRPEETAEDVLTSQLCRYMNNVARMSQGWDFLQFRTEEADEIHKNRSIDLIPVPLAATIWIDGREYNHYSSLMPIECKRLPTPRREKRDKREYLFSIHSTSGGIQRFKEGYHGSVHSIGAMIAYIQERDVEFWAREIDSWLLELIEGSVDGWSNSDTLHGVSRNLRNRSAEFKSVHSRVGKIPPIHLRHLWIEMSR